MKNIYITIASAEEQFLEQTILSAYNNSSKKNNLFFKILNQSTTNKIINFEHLNFNIEIINYLSKELHGLGKARMISNCTDLTFADYVLQIDSHMIFSNNWDDYLINYLDEVKKYHQKSVISGYAIAWKLKENKITVNDKIIDPLNFDCDKENIGYGRIPLWSIMPPKVLEQRKHSDANNGYPLSGATEFIDDNEYYKEIHSVAGNFIFAEKDLFENITHDPWIFWGGDEIVFSMRIWTRGYKIFALNKPVILHQDKDNWRNLEKDWRGYYDWSKITIKDFGYLRIRDILLGKIIGYWGAPSLNKLKEYENFIGYNFQDFYQKKEYLEEIKNSLQKIKYGDTLG